MGLQIGAIADDFTGATDLASELVSAGMRVVQTIGSPDAPLNLSEVDAVVVALKSRSIPTSEAVALSLEALNWLRREGAQQILFKYCSTFDSTPEGNIGPVADALLEATESDFALVCPAFPENGRTVYKGHLFVHDDLLSDSPMKDHPLNPMHDPNLLRLMRAQTQWPVGLIDLATVRAGPDRIRARIADLAASGHRYGIVEAVETADLATIGVAACDHSLVTGGSAIGAGLATAGNPTARPAEAAAFVMPQGGEAVIAGSCSAATLNQIAAVDGTWSSRKLDLDRLATGEDEVGDILAWARAEPADARVLVYSSDTPEEIARRQASHGRVDLGTLIEDALASVAVGLRESGFCRLVVAGGETSGAVVTRLGVGALGIGPRIAPGVPWTRTLDGTPIALALKSGNFGSKSFFSDAFEVFDE